jgi:hypothetical protein
MAAGSVLFKQADIKRAVAGALAAGLTVERIEIAKDGTIVVIATVPDGRQDEAAAAYDGWKVRHAR